MRRDKMDQSATQGQAVEKGDEEERRRVGSSTSQNIGSPQIDLDYVHVYTPASLRRDMQLKYSTVHNHACLHSQVS